MAELDRARYAALYGPTKGDQVRLADTDLWVEIEDDLTAGGEEAAMHLSPADTEKLLLSVAGMVARDRLERGVKLNHPEAVALLCTWVVERAREGALVADLMEQGRQVLRRDQVMAGVPEMITEVQVEATFPDGRKLVTLHQPID